MQTSLLSRFLARRGVTYETYRDIDNPAHNSLTYIDEAVELIRRIGYDEKKLVVILPDFDCDGIMSAIVGYVGLSEVGLENVGLFCPQPSLGYGFDEHEANRLLSEFGDVGLVVTCDVGITCNKGVAALVAGGADVLVTDHHLEGKQRVMADVVVDPCCKDSSYAHHGICGAYVLWQVVDEYARRYCTEDVRDNIERLRVFAGIGTVSDQMPMLWENRQLVRDAISICRVTWSNSDKWFVDSLEGSHYYKSAFLGLWNLLDGFATRQRIKTVDDIDEEFFGWNLAPAMNAVKRMDQSPALAYDIFLNPQKSAESVQRLLDLNEARKALVSDSIQRMVEDTQPFAPYVYITNAPGGIRGLMAMQMEQRTGHASCVVARDESGRFFGSGRAPEWLDANRLINEAGLWARGHEHAFGCGADDEQGLALMRDALQDGESAAIAAGKAVTREMWDFAMSPYGSDEDTGDGIIKPSVSQLASFISEVDTFAPFGPQFEPPCVKLDIPAGYGTVRIIGKDSQHLKIGTDYGITALSWNAADMAYTAQTQGVSVVGRPKVNVWNDKRSIEIVGDVMPLG